MEKKGVNLPPSKENLRIAQSNDAETVKNDMEFQGIAVP